MKIFGFGDAIVAAALVAAVAINPPAYAANAFATVASAIGCATTGACVSMTSANGALDVEGRSVGDSTGRGPVRNKPDGGGRRGLFRNCGRRLRVFGLR